MLMECLFIVPIIASPDGRDAEWSALNENIFEAAWKTFYVNRCLRQQTGQSIKLSEVIEHVPRLNQHKARLQHHRRLSARTTSINKIK